MIRLLRIEILTAPPGKPDSRVVRIHPAGRAFATGGIPAWEPPADLYETEHHVVVEFNLAGVQPSVVRIEMTPRMVQITGSRLEPVETNPRAYHLLEIERGAFARAIKLPAPVQPSSAQVNYADGLLTVRLNKAVGGHLHACDIADSVEGFE
ncbi:Hsp20/alpha crystallin family protein [candidate division KSB1 bacterium]|nr:Hsp20/alpha crystallin family protein [candidate division KSB1 bacterium]